MYQFSIADTHCMRITVAARRSIVSVSLFLLLSFFSFDFISRRKDKVTGCNLVIFLKLHGSARNILDAKHGEHKISRTILKWHKCGCLCISLRSPPNLTIHMDVEANAGITTAHHLPTTKSVAGIVMAWYKITPHHTYRGNRAGKRVQERRQLPQFNIEIVVSHHRRRPQKQSRAANCASLPYLKPIQQSNPGCHKL